MSLNTEKALWAHLQPRLIGRWYRVEAVTPVGFLDVFGFYRGETHIIELKVGKPDVKALEPGQHDMIMEALKQGGPAWCCFAHRGTVRFFRGLPIGYDSDPPFYRRGPLTPSPSPIPD